MSKMQFTPAQQDAVNALGGSIIVSAAAGSGKTRVLVQRVIKRLTDKENPVSADKLLIVTFTKAAAAEMKSRISSAIEEMLYHDPGNDDLRRQQLLLPKADICTIHSFCNRIIKENFYALDIDRDFKIGTDSEMAVIKHRTISDMIEEKYADDDENFIILSEILSGTRSDIEFEKTLLSLYETVSSRPFPSDWLMQASENYCPDIPLGNTKTALLAYDTVQSVIRMSQHLLERIDEIISGNEAFQAGNKTSADTKYDYLCGFIRQLEKAAESREWNNIYHVVHSFSKVTYRRPTSKKVSVEEYEHRTLKSSFDAIDNAVTGKLMVIFGIDEETYLNDCRQLYPVVKCMCEFLTAFDDRYLEAKKERSLFEFSDLEHFMLRLLYEKHNGEYVKSKFACDLSMQYDEVMVDEYQDTNEVQERIFSAVSKDGSNLFVVGDVKQSIYRFREAEPKIFIGRRDRSLPYDREHPVFPSKIILDKNFRSREGIIDSINFVFQCLMSEDVGDIEYNDEESLKAGAIYPESPDGTPETEIHIIQKKIDDDQDAKKEYESSEEELSDREREAWYIARLIKEKVQNKEMVTDNGTLRPVRYGDFCVLMRNLSTHAHTYCDILNRHGIPAYTDKPYSLFDCYEVNVLISFLKIVDNPMREIPLLSLLLSPTTGFTPDDLALLKTETSQKNFYSKIIEYSQKEDTDISLPLRDKCREFMASMTYYRSMSVSMNADGVLELFFEKTGYIPVMSAVENGDIKVRNIRKFMNFVRQYTENFTGSLSEFVRYLIYLEDNGTEIAAGDTVPENSVKFMTIHHSKGLEFPICILASLSSKGDSRTPGILCHNELGFGFNTIDRENMFKFSTLQKNIIHFQSSRESLSEEMRILYVAMTRAKEKLIPVISISSRSQNAYSMLINKIGSMIHTENGRLSPDCVESAGSFAEWLLMCAFVHPRVSLLRDDSGINDIETIPTKARWSLTHSFISSNTEEIFNTVQEQSSETETVECDPALMNLFYERFGQKYPYEERTAVPAKVAASRLAHKNSKEKNSEILLSRPGFMQDKRMSGAEKGTAMHLFLQYADFANLSANPGKEKQRLVDKAFMTTEQAACINEEDIKGFTDSDIYQKIISTDKENVYREFRFTVNISAGDADENYHCDDEIILQGAMDCLIVEEKGITVIDYKTDRVKDVSQLAERYAEQLMLYKRAAEQIFEKSVTRCVIYSTHHRTSIDIDC